MSHYPFRHSTYWTGGDPVYTSELPPMNSAEDILQDVFMRDRNTIHAARPGKLQGLKNLMRAVGNWRRDRVHSSLLMLSRTMRKGF
ncbi:hypothetical protein HYPSUDRAFT_199819 [Hypholoma sublateritium FD-334 SS-4]|uniref:Uncharacterized protein n=1 Tax=Hypholoma sublateritium (strain FD-334 SS-4) TaxID=945553 RepID=A0A0D2P9M0_HYPSF|nr:hypothetical protein HYPSUDRAFT_199819 [Hypholoma sublateritium FD-334 SS-4]